MLSNNNKKKCKKIREQGTTSNVLSIVWAPAYIFPYSNNYNKNKNNQKNQIKMKNENKKHFLFFN